MKTKQFICCGIASLMLAACNTAAVDDGFTKSGLDKSKFESVADGKPTHLYVMTNSRGMEVCVTNYGGRIVAGMGPGKDGELRGVGVGHDSIAGYLKNDGDFGAVISRDGNRIKQSRVKIGDI